MANFFLSHKHVKVAGHLAFWGKRAAIRPKDRRIQR
jgi:hypothetical protein